MMRWYAGLVLLLCATAVALGVWPVLLRPAAAQDITSNLVAHWTFDSTANSATGAHNATLQGNPTYAAGKFGNALVLDGVGDYATAPDDAALEPAALTVAGWIKTSTVLANMLVNKMNASSPFQGWALCFNTLGAGSTTDNGALAVWTGDGSWLAVSLGVGVISDNQWHHLAFTNNGSTTRLYFDGTERTTDSSTLTLATTSGVLIGRHVFSGADITGSIDDIRVYSRALSAGDITALFSGGVARRMMVVP